MYYKKIVGKNIYLSPLNADDFSLYTKWLNDDLVSKNINQIQNIITEDFEKKWINSAYEKGRYHFAIVNLINNLPIGICGLELTNNISKRYHFVYFIGEKREQNKGYGTESLILLLKFAFDYLNAHTVHSTIYEFNDISLKIANKLGFTFVGRYKESIYQNSKYYDEVIIEMTKNDYIKIKKDYING